MLTFADIFEAHADEFPEACAIAYGDQEVTWAQYDEWAARLAAAFGDLGLGLDSKVGMFMYNCPEYLVTQYAAFKSRVTPVNVNYRYLDDELLYLLDNADCEALVFSTVHLFSSKVADISLAQLKAGQCQSTGGTDIGCVAEHMQKHGVQRALLVTDGWVGSPKGQHLQTLTQARLAVAYLGESINPNDLKGVTNHTASLNTGVSS